MASIPPKEAKGVKVAIVDRSMPLLAILRVRTLPDRA